MSYYDLDAILTDAEKIPCTFQLDVPELGYLDNNPGHTLKSGTNVLLPLWLAEMLAIANMGDDQNPDKSFIAFDLPPAVGKDVMAALKADPRSVPLRIQSPNFYNLAKHMMDLAEEQELHAVVRKAFITRAADISLHARKAGGAGSKDEGSNLGIGAAGEEFLRGLDEWERILFRKAHDGARSTKEWIEGVKKR
ncbi:DNA replication complex GINS protein psf-3 [Rhypophila sp. PSN 637]